MISCHYQDSQPLSTALRRSAFSYKLDPVSLAAPSGHYNEQSSLSYSLGLGTERSGLKGQCYRLREAINLLALLLQRTYLTNVGIVPAIKQ